jgi:hypothetical protein
MQSSKFVKAGLLAAILSFVAVASWELYLRYQKTPLFYDDNEALWSDKRAMVYKPSNEATVFIGSSRIKYDLDIPTWVTLTGQDAIQLANQGSNPRPVLDDLANDINFKGKLIIDVTEPLFFGAFAPRDEDTYKKMAYFKKRTPTQRVSFEINRVLESKFIFLDQDDFTINAMLDQVMIPPRPGVFRLPVFPFDFGGNYFTRQSFMTPRFVADTNLQNQVKAIWHTISSLPMPPPPRGEELQAIMNSVKVNVDKIKSRGGQIIFVRTPSSGPFRMGEMKGFPREVYWNQLLAITGCPGIYFEDYPATAHLICPEWSHLKPSDAVIYTRSLVGALEEKGWSFGKTTLAQ